MTWVMIVAAVAVPAFIAILFAKVLQRRGDQEVDPWLIDAQRSIDTRVTIRYRAADGEASERTVRVKRFGQYDGEAYIFAYCELRRANRTFRLDRVKAAINEEGKRIPDLLRYLSDLYLASPQRAADELREEHLDVLRVLFYVGKADGRLTSIEKGIIRHVCKQLAKDERLTDAQLDKMLRELSVPSLHAFRLAVSRIAKRDRACLELVADAARQIVGTQKTTHPDEQLALEYLAKQGQ
jgi:HEAT repeat protein